MYSPLVAAVTAYAALSLAMPQSGGLMFQDLSQHETHKFVRQRVLDSSVKHVHDTMSSGLLDCRELFDHDDKWSLNLGHSSIVAERTSFTDGYAGYLTWSGVEVDNPLTTVLISWHEQMVGADGVCDSSMFSLTVRQHLGEGNRETRSVAIPSETSSHIGVYQVTLHPEPAAMPRYANNSKSIYEPKLSKRQLASAVALVPQPAGCTTMVDLLLVWTMATEIKQGGRAQMLAYAAQQYAQFNSTFEHHALPLRLRIVFGGSVDFQGASGSEDYDALKQGNLKFVAGNGDATGKTIAEWRVAVGADVIQMITMTHVDGTNEHWCGQSDSGGIPLTQGVAGQQVSVVSYACFAYYSHLHEFSHLFGLNHNAEFFGSGVRLFGYGYGFCSALKFRTIMSYDCATNGTPRQPFFSSSTELFNGQATGSANADNLRALKNALPYMSNVRPSKWVTDGSCQYQPLPGMQAQSSQSTTIKVETTTSGSGTSPRQISGTGNGMGKKGSVKVLSVPSPAPLPELSISSQAVTSAAAPIVPAAVIKSVASVPATTVTPIISARLEVASASGKQTNASSPVVPAIAAAVNTPHEKPAGTANVNSVKPEVSAKLPPAGSLAKNIVVQQPSVATSQTNAPLLPVGMKKPDQEFASMANSTQPVANKSTVLEPGNMNVTCPLVTANGQTALAHSLIGISPTAGAVPTVQVVGGSDKTYDGKNQSSSVIAVAGGKKLPAFSGAESNFALSLGLSMLLIICMMA